MADLVRLPAFLRLDPVAGWRLSPLSAGVAEDPATGTLGLGPVASRADPLVEPGGSLGGLTLPTGVAVGPDGEVLVADPEGGVILINPHPGLWGPDAATAPGFAPLWPRRAAPAAPGACDLSGAAPPGPHDLVSPRGLCFTRDGDLAVADEGDAATPGRLIVYAWPSLAARAVVALGGRPSDVALAGDGRLLVADPAMGVVRRLDRLRREEAWIGGAGGLNAPRHLVVDEGGAVLVIDADPATGAGRLVRLDGLGRARPLAADEARALWHGRYPAPVRRVADVLHAPATGSGDLGRAMPRARVDRLGRLPQGPLLVHPGPQARLLRQGDLVTEALDGGGMGFAWHRLAIEADLPDGTAIEVRTTTSESELEPGRVDALPDQAWSRRIVLLPGARPEVLIQSPPGRWLWLRLGLTGDGTRTPSLRGIDVLGPRRSSLRFLPEPFHEDPVSRDFLDRFLSYFDTVFAEADQRARDFAANLSPQGVDAWALAWLASWFDLALLARWPEATRRAFLAQAMAINRGRGTVPGLKAVLGLHLGVAEPMPVLIESFRLRDYSGRRSAGDVAADGLRLAGVRIEEPAGGFAHRFLLVLPEALVPDDDARADLVRLVDLFRPAHTEWDLLVAPPGVWIGCQSTVGVDMVLGTTPQAPLGAARLAQDARLYAPPQAPPRLGAAVLRGP